ncbi:MAG: hypothetical protein HYV32_00600 [Candidatus Kerfeldbacteria bacterium]|nr:hypothetical protein [Candidatus Kerfeldbacteria bacterium]
MKKYFSTFFLNAGGVFFIVACSFIFFASPSYAVGIGVSPAGINNSDLVSDMIVDQKVVVSRSDSTQDQELTYEVSDEIREIVDIVETGDQLVVTQGMISLPVTVRLDTTAIPAGEYHGNIIFGFNNRTDGSTVGNDDTVDALAYNNSGVTLDVKLTVSNTVKEEYAIAQSAIEPTEEGQDMVLTIFVDNTGNVKAGPDMATIQFLRLSDRSLVSTQTISMNSLLSPFTYEGMKYTVPHTLQPGQYIAHILLYEKDEEIYASETPFDIYPKGTLKKKGVLKTVSTKGTIEIGSSVALVGVFENVGEGTIVGKMVSEIYHNDQLLTTVSTEEKIIDEGESVEFSNYYTPERLGAYMAKSYVSYYGRTSAAVSTPFEVKDITMRRIFIATVIIAFVILLIIGLAYILICKMNNKCSLRRFTPVILFLCLLFVALLLWAGYRIYSNADTSSSSASVTNVVPVMSAVSINSAAASITLTENTTTSVTVTGTATDNNGCEDITSVAYVFYRTNHASGAGCSADDNDCYTGTCTIDGGSCTAGGADLTSTYTCTINTQYFADATDDSSSRSTTSWTAQLTPSDGSSGTASTDTIEMSSLAAINVTATTVYGTLALAGTSSNQTVTIDNTGNTRLDTQISGTNMSCTIGTISAAQQKFGTTDVVYASLTNALQTSATEYDLDIAQRTGVATNASTYWGLQLPSTGVDGSCTGTNTFTAVNDDITAD